MADRRLSVRDKVCGTRKRGAALRVNHQSFSHLSLLDCDGISRKRHTQAPHGNFDCSAAG
jgi:hypothetical protein